MTASSSSVPGRAGDGHPAASADRPPSSSRRTSGARPACSGRPQAASATGTRQQQKLKVASDVHQRNPLGPGYFTRGRTPCMGGFLDRANQPQTIPAGLAPRPLARPPPGSALSTPAGPPGRPTQRGHLSVGCSRCSMPPGCPRNRRRRACAARHGRGSVLPRGTVRRSTRSGTRPGAVRVPSGSMAPRRLSPFLLHGSGHNCSAARRVCDCPPAVRYSGMMDDPRIHRIRNLLHGRPAAMDVPGARAEGGRRGAAAASGAIRRAAPDPSGRTGRRPVVGPCRPARRPQVGRRPGPPRDSVQGDRGGSGCCSAAGRHVHWRTGRDWRRLRRCYRPSPSRRSCWPCRRVLAPCRTRGRCSAPCGCRWSRSGRPPLSPRWKSTLPPGRRNFPCFVYEDLTIWGLTFRILQQFLDLTEQVD
jgi:hypothetical protein